MQNYPLEENEGIYTEVFDSTNVNLNRYTNNNVIYKESNELTYNFEYINIYGAKYYFKVNETKDERKNQWKFVNTDSVNQNTIKRLKMRIRYGLKPKS